MTFAANRIEAPSTAANATFGVQCVYLHLSQGCLHEADAQLLRVARIYYFISLHPNLRTFEQCAALCETFHFYKYVLTRPMPGTRRAEKGNAPNSVKTHLRYPLVNVITTNVQRARDIRDAIQASIRTYKVVFE